MYIRWFVFFQTLMFSASIWSAEGRYIVKFKDPLRAEGDIQNCGGKSERKLKSKSHAVRLNSDSFKKLRDNSNIESIEIDHLRFPLATETIPWGMIKVQATDPVFDVTNASEGVSVCVIDSGYQASHEDLQDVTSGYLTGSNDPISGNWYEDTCGHGSHVAGTISALKNGIGLVGVNKNGKLRLHIEKVFNGVNCGWSYSSDLVAAVERCLASVRGTGRKLVINMSLGGVAPTSLEQEIFKTAQAEGALVVAAAGNAGNSELNYPAGYNTVISVGAIDILGQKAPFSQFNSDVELTAPGVDVISTTPSRFEGINITGSAKINVTAQLANGDFCLSSNSTWTGKIVLCQRGTNSFAEKANNVTNSGGVGVIIYNNISGSFFGELTPSTSRVPVVSISREDGLVALNYINETATLMNSLLTPEVGILNTYRSYQGTSMATPHVSGVAALIWSLNLSKSNTSVRLALQNSAIDMGDPGRDTHYGFGIVQAKAALESLKTSLDSPVLTDQTIGITPQSVSFGAVTVGSSTTQNLTITNTHNAPITLTNATIYSDTTSPYRLTNSCNSSLLPGSSCNMVITFSPTSAANFPATLSIQPSIGDISFIPIVGQAANATPSFNISSSSLAFGNQAVNNNTEGKIITVSNTGGTSLSLSSTWLRFSTTGQFSQTNNCSSTLAIGATCTIVVTFRPTTTGAKSSTLTLAPTGVTSKTVSLTGSGVTPVVTLTPTTLAFGTLKSNTLSAPKIVTIRNSGTVAISTMPITFTGTGANQYRQTNNCPAIFVAGASCTVSITFAPTSTGSKSARLSVAPSGGTAKTTTLSGTGN
jgi:serine protease